MPDTQWACHTNAAAAATAHSAADTAADARADILHELLVWHIVHGCGQMHRAMWRRERRIVHRAFDVLFSGDELPHFPDAGADTAADAADAGTNGLLLYEGPPLRGGPGRGRGLCPSWDGLLGILWRQNCQQNEVRLVHGDAQ